MATAFAFAFVASAMTARAQPSHASPQVRGSYIDDYASAPSRTFELKFGTGYAQGWGNLAPGKNINEVAGAGVGVSVDADARVNPYNSAGIEVQYQEFARENNRGARGLAMSFGVTHHVSPNAHGDGWARAGVGYRLLWEVDPAGALATTNLYHGFDLLTLKVGYDIRTGSDVALAPVIGVDLQSFFWINADQMAHLQVGGYVYAGIQGRFDATTPATR